MTYITGNSQSQKILIRFMDKEKKKIKGDGPH
jgi:hypothetical protein